MRGLRSRWRRGTRKIKNEKNDEGHHEFPPSERREESRKKSDHAESGDYVESRDAEVCWPFEWSAHTIEK